MFSRNDCDQVREGFGIEERDRHRHGAANIIGEIRIEVIHHNIDLHRLVVPDTRIEVRRNSDDSHDTPCLDQIVCLARACLLQRKTSSRLGSRTTIFLISPSWERRLMICGTTL